MRWLSRPQDEVRDVLVDIKSRMGRAMLLVLAVAFSSGALVASIGISSTASAQIRNDIAADALDEVTVFPASADASPPTQFFPEGGVEAVRALELVDGVGLRMDMDLKAAAPRRLAEAAPAHGVQVMGLTPGYLSVVGAQGGEHLWWMLDDPLLDVAFLGADAADRLGVPLDGAARGVEIIVAGVTYSVGGVLTGAEREDLSTTIVVPYEDVVTWAGSDSTARLRIRTAVGAGAAVAEVATAAVRPEHPASLTSTRVVDLDDLNRGVDTQLSRMTALVGAILVLLTGLLIANSMVVSVITRRSEIGLRRALGASRSSVLRLFLLEGGFLGLMGGVGGAAFGFWATNVASIVSGWTTVLPWWLLIAGPLIGVTTGVLASIYPALRAARTSPALAIRHD